MRICDMCGIGINRYSSIRFDRTICLGGTLQTYDLCGDCVAKVRNFVEKQAEKNNK